MPARSGVVGVIGSAVDEMLLASAASASAAVLGVNAHDDADDGVCDVIHCSLREAINSANRTADNEEYAVAAHASRADSRRWSFMAPETLTRAISFR